MRRTTRVAAVAGTAACLVAGLVPVTLSGTAAASTAPQMPVAFRVVAQSSVGVSLLWDGPKATKYVVTQANDPGLSAGVRRYYVDGRQHQVTPLDLVPGRSYYFAVQAFNGSTPSVRTPVLETSAPSGSAGLRLMSYNVLGKSNDGKVFSGTRVAPWSKRRWGVVGLIRKANPDLIALQEASDWVGARKGPRQADDIRAMLGSEWAVARTEVPPWEPAYFRTGRYLLYKTTVLRPVGAGGHWKLAPKRWAAYQMFEHIATGARFLAVSVHLQTGNGRAIDNARAAQTRTLLASVRSFLAGVPTPVLYMGDFNSHEKRPVRWDAPGAVMRAAHMSDADEAAWTKVDRTLNSANKYLRKAPRTSSHVDHVYLSPGVGVRRFQVLARLSKGRIVGVIPSDHNPLVVDVTVPYRVG